VQLQAVLNSDLESLLMCTNLNTFLRYTTVNVLSHLAIMFLFFIENRIIYMPKVLIVQLNLSLLFGFYQFKPVKFLNTKKNNNIAPIRRIKIIDFRSRIFVEELY